MQTLMGWYAIAWPIVSGILLGIVVLAAGWLASKWVNRLVHGACRRAKLNEALARFLGSMARYVVIAAAVIAALGAVGIQTTSLIAVFATAGLAIGLALQGSLASFASGVMILFFRPFDLGDAVKIAGETGEVKDIGLFATTLVTANNETVIVPNAAITAGNITNYTRLGTRRATILVSGAYGTNVARMHDVLLEATQRCSLVLREPAPAIALTGFAPSALEFTVTVWSRASDWEAAQDQVRRSIHEALNRAHIDIPFPRTIVEQIAHA